ncbi:MAG: replicative DNA helicase [Pirellulales bacterium]|nr:replicative DNA helicase [Pirellulales bacterium]
MNIEILDRLPPSSTEAEKNLLGSILLDPRVLDEIAIGPEDFYAEAHGVLFQHLRRMHRDGKATDSTTLLDHLTISGDLERIGGPDYLREVAQSVPYVVNAPHYAQIVREKAKLRSIINVCTTGLQAAYGNDKADDVLNTLEAGLSFISTEAADNATSSALDVSIDAVERIDGMLDRNQHIGLTTGMENFDSVFGGLFDGELNILAARPGIGKTSLALQIAQYIAGRGGTVLFVSLEMAARELMTRLACTVSGVSGQRVRNGQLVEWERERLSKAFNEVGNLLLYIRDSSASTVYDVRREARRLVKKGLRLVVVDYLQLLQPEDRRQPRLEQVTTISKGLKNLARELDLPVLCCCQLNREAEKNDRPSLHHLRESGSIEQDADVVMFLNRQRQTSEAELIVSKNRNGKCGVLKLSWEATTTKYTTTTPSPASNQYAGDFEEFQR